VPTSDQIDRLPPTTSSVYLLLDLTIAGHTYRIADEYLEVAHEDGTTLVYVEGLSADAESSAAFFADSLGEVSMPVSVVVPDIDWAELVGAGHDLAAGRATLSRWADGTTYGQRQVLIRGQVSEPSFGALGEPLSFSLSTAPIDDGGIWPPSGAVVDSETWPNAHETAEGKRYPWVFGCPGWWDASDGGRVQGTPALCIDVDQDYWLIAGHPVKATSVWWRNMADPTSYWQLANVGSGATGFTDARNNTISYIQNLGIDLGGDVGVDVWVSWSPLPCGWILTPNGAALVDGETFDIDDGATAITFEFDSGGGVGGGNVAVTFAGGDTATQIGEAIIAAVNAQDWTIRAIRGANTTQFRVVMVNTQPGTAGNVSITDTVASGLFTHAGMEGGLNEATRGGLAGRSGAIEGAGELLEWWLGRTTLDVDRGMLASLRSRLDAYRVSGYVDEQVVPWSWVQSHLLDLLPVSFVVGASGLQPVLWRYHASEIDAVFRFDVDLLEAERTGAVEVGDPTDVANVLTLNWCLRADEDEHVRSTTLDGSEPGSGTYAARLSYLRYGRRERVTDTDLVYDPGTAGRILGWQSYAYGLPALHVSYEVPRSGAMHLLLGDVVSVTDDELHFDDRRFHVVGLRDEGSGSLEIALRSLEEPSRT
jgi:hypothetical protein